MDFWWRVLSFFVLCHFCGSNGSKVRGLGILSSSKGFRAYSNAYKSLIKTNTGVLLDIRTIIGHEIKCTMSTWPPNFPHCVLYWTAWYTVLYTEFVHYLHLSTASTIFQLVIIIVWKLFSFLILNNTFKCFSGYIY